MEVTALELYYHIDRILVPNSLQSIKEFFFLRGSRSKNRFLTRNLGRGVAAPSLSLPAKE